MLETDEDLFIRYLRVCEEELSEHSVFAEAQICARGGQHFLQELLHCRSCHFALFSRQHFGSVVRCEDQPESFCVKPQLEHQQLCLFS